MYFIYISTNQACYQTYKNKNSTKTNGNLFPYVNGQEVSVVITESGLMYIKVDEPGTQILWFVIF